MTEKNNKEIDKIHQEYLEMELQQIEKRIQDFQGNVVTAKERQQIKNLIDKIENRKLLTDFKIEIKEGVKNMSLTTFLKAIPTELSKDNKESIKLSLKRKNAILLLLGREE